jgi:WD40 repeat protein
MGDKLASVFRDRGPTGSGDDQVIIFDSATFQEIGRVPISLFAASGIKDQGVYDLAWRSDGSQLAIAKVGSASGVPTLEVWDVSTIPFQQVFEYSDIVSTISFPAVAWQPGGTRIAFGGSHLLLIIDIDSGNITRLMPDAGDYLNISTIQWSPDGSRFVSGESGNAHVWDGNTGALLTILDQDAHTSPLAWSPDGAELALEFDGSIRIWDMNTYTPVRTLDGAIEYTDKIDWQGNTIASFNSTREGLSIYVWNAETGQRIQEIPLNVTTSSFALSPDGTQLAYGGDSALLEIEDVTFRN